MAGQEWKTLFEMDETALLYRIYQLQGNAGFAIFNGMVMDVSDRIPFVTGNHLISDRYNRVFPGEILLKAVVQSVLKGHSCNDFLDLRFRRCIQKTCSGESCPCIPFGSAGVFIGPHVPGLPL